MEVVQQRLSELTANRGAGKSCPCEQCVVQRPGLPELIAELAQSSAVLNHEQLLTRQRNRRFHRLEWSKMHFKNRMAAVVSFNGVMLQERPTRRP
jgi:hypothetical protein